MLRKILIAGLASALVSFAAPALAAQSLSPCDPSANITPDAVTCKAFAGNLVSGTSLTDSNALTYAASIGYTGNGSFAELLSGLSGQSTIDFASALTGINYILVHYGAAGDGAQGTSLFEVDGGTAGISSFTFDRGGLSNAALLGPVGGAVPEPATWAMMLLGFGAMGVNMRRRGIPSMMQIA